MTRYNVYNIPSTKTNKPLKLFTFLSIFSINAILINDSVVIDYFSIRNNKLTISYQIFIHRQLDDAGRTSDDIQPV